MGSVLKLQQRCVGWLETEWLHKVVHVKQGDLFATRTVFMLCEPKNRANRSQSARSSVEASVMDVERRERRKVDSLWTDKRKKDPLKCQRLSKREKSGTDGPGWNRLPGRSGC
jgi:hypothetical protein